MQSSYVSSNFRKKLLNFENISPADNEIASLMDTTVRYENVSPADNEIASLMIHMVKSLSQQDLLRLLRSQHNRHQEKSAHAVEQSHTIDNRECRRIKSLTRGVTMINLRRKLCPCRGSKISNIACAEEPRTSFDELMDTPIDFSAFVINRLNITNLTQELLVGPAFNILKGTCKSCTELGVSFDDVLILQLTRTRLDIIPKASNIRRSLSRKYSTSVTKIKAATYVVQWIEDMVPKFMESVKVVTCLKIMKWYDYDHLDEIEVRREDQQLYTFKEGDFLRLRLQDIEDMLLLLVQQRLTNVLT
ncbi:hypothetical protein Tco_0607820 [Tanacetum coccineum]